MGEEKDSDTVGIAMKLPLDSNENKILSSENIHLKIETPEVLVRSKANGEKGSVEDDELTSLSWLQDTNLLKNMRMGTYSEESEDVLSDSPTNDLLEDPLDLSNDGVGRVMQHGMPVVYNPKLHINGKPPYSFSCLIFMAIEASPNKALPVKDIYSWILAHFPYFRDAPTGWKNSVRHNLSLNKCFRKKDLGQSIGKGSLWCIDPDFRPNLLHAIRRAPYYPYAQIHHFHRLSVQSIAQNAGGAKHMPLTPAVQSNVNIPSPDLFPYLSKRLAASGSKGDPEADAAATMLALKNGSQASPQKEGTEESQENRSTSHRKRKRKYLMISAPDVDLVEESKGKKLTPVITSSPSEDHTYSASPSQHTTGFSSNATNSPGGSSIDEAFEFSDGGASNSHKSDSNFSSQDTDDDECTNTLQADDIKVEDLRVQREEVVGASGHSHHREEDEEHKKITGAHALLNLAKVASIKRDFEYLDTVEVKKEPESNDKVDEVTHLDDR